MSLTKYRPASTSSWDDVIYDIKMSEMDYNTVKEFLDWVNGLRWTIMLPLLKLPRITLELEPYIPIEPKKLSIPLSFWFGTFRSPPRPVIKNPTTDYVCQNINEIEKSCDLEYLRDLNIKVNDEDSRWQRSSGFFVVTFETIFDQAREIINARICELTIPTFNTPLIMSKDETVNSYQLYDCKQNCMTSDLYIELKELLEDPSERLSYEEFVESARFCSDWNKCNLVNDNPIDYDNEDWWEDTFNYNVRAVWDLPFHTKFLARTIDIGCSNRQESPRYSNFLGIWVQRKTQQLRQVVKTSIHDLNNNELDPLESIVANFVI